MGLDSEPGDSSSAMPYDVNECEPYRDVPPYHTDTYDSNDDPHRDYEPYFSPAPENPANLWTAPVPTFNEAVPEHAMPIVPMDEAEDEPEPERVRLPSQEQAVLDEAEFDGAAMEAAERTATIHDEVEASGLDSRAAMFDCSNT